MDVGLQTLRSAVGPQTLGSAVGLQTLGSAVGLQVRQVPTILKPVVVHDPRPATWGSHMDRWQRTGGGHMDRWQRTRAETRAGHEGSRQVRRQGQRRVQR